MNLIIVIVNSAHKSIVAGKLIHRRLTKIKSTAEVNIQRIRQTASQTAMADGV